MKKVILVVLAVFLVMGTMAAQEVKIGDGTLTFNGKITTGIEVQFDDADNEDGRVRMYTDTDDTRLRAELGATYTSGNVGFKTVFRTNDAQSGSGPVSIPAAYGWINLFDGHFRPVGGFVDENVWGTKGDLDKDVNGAGLRLEIKPIEGLNFGAFLRVPSQSESNVLVNGGPLFKDDDDDEDDTPDFWGYVPQPNLTIEQFIRSTALGFGYTHPAFYLRLQYLIDASPTGTVSLTDDDPDKNGQLDFGIGFTGLPALTASVEGRIEKLDDFTDGNGKGDFRETVAYTISDALPLTIGLNVQEILYGDDDIDPWLQFNPWVSYAVSKALSVGLGGGYAVGFKGGYQHDSLIYVKPNLSYNFGNGLAIKLWYQFKNFEIKGAEDPVNENTIQFEFVYSF